MKTRLTCMILLAAGAALAQKNDLGILIGVNGPASRTITTEGTTAKVETTAGGNLQINYATLLRENKVGKLYLELPLLIGARGTEKVEGSVSNDTQTGVYFTPGLRYAIPVSSRISLYGAAGIGVAAFGRTQHVVKMGSDTWNSDWSSSLAGQYGGGVDFKLSNLLSFRAEGRDFISRRGVSLNDGRHHSVFNMGLGFHW